MVVENIQLARRQLREIARALEAIKYWLLGAHASVPLSSPESHPLAEVDVTTDPVAGFHGAVEHILDKIGALMNDVLEVAGLAEPEEEA
jgi:hypothetical protein